MAGVLRTHRVRERRAADGRRDAVCECAVPPHRCPSTALGPSGGRRCTTAPIRTSCVIARPCRSKTPPTQTPQRPAAQQYRTSDHITATRSSSSEVSVANANSCTARKLRTPSSERDAPTNGESEASGWTRYTIGDPPPLEIVDARITSAVRSKTYHPVSDAPPPSIPPPAAGGKPAGPRAG